jgi:membrane protease YdiL (CAAX protease family)
LGTDDKPRGAGREPTGRAGIVVFAVLFEGSLAPLALAAGWLLGHPPLSGFAWDARDAAVGAAAALPLLGLLALGLRWPVGPLARIKRFFDEEVKPVLGSRPWPDLALISVAAGVGEEMLFRGVLQGALVRSLGPGAGLAAASLLFGLLHPITPAYAVIAALMGAYLGAVWLLNGNLLAVMVTHALYDFLALLVLLRDRPLSSAEC